MLEKKYITQSEVLEKSGVSRYTLYLDIKKGKINCLHAGRRLLFEKNEVDKYIQEKNESKMVILWREKKNCTRSKN